MRLLVKETILGVKTETLREVDEMKCKCFICVLWYGNVAKSDKLKLKTIEGRDYLVCRKHYNVTTINRRVYEKGRVHDQTVSR